MPSPKYTNHQDEATDGARCFTAVAKSDTTRARGLAAITSGESLAPHNSGLQIPTGANNSM